MFNRLLLLVPLLLVAININSQTLAFPSAEGFGKHTVGGRGGKVLLVTNLNDSGEGSLRDAVEKFGARIVVFKLSGTIELKSPLRISNDSITIAGQSAPGDGICLKDFPLIINASEVIVRYIRVRPGDKSGRDYDALSGGGGKNQKNVILDHLSVSWSVDECLSFYRVENLTVQWCLITHSLTASVHTKGNHGFGGIWGGNKASFHHNLLANHSSRNPRFASYENTKSVDIRNNVIFNWGYKTTYGGGRYGEINMIKNYFKPGPASTMQRFLDVADDGTGRYFLEGNVMEGNQPLNEDNWLGVGGKNFRNSRVDTPFHFDPIKEETVQNACLSVLKNVGCNFKRDSYDKKTLKHIKSGKTTAGRKGLIDHPDEVGGWPVLKSKKSPVDSDNDGIPDSWERKNGLNPNDPQDNSKHNLNTEYTNIEVYLNSLLK